MGHVAVVGSLNLDLVATADRHPAPGETVIGDSYAEHAGGKGLNQAVAAARCGVATGLTGAVGEDEAGDRLTAIAAEAGIDVSTLRRREQPTGRAIITVAGSGENSIVVVPGANGRLRPGDVEGLADRRPAVVLCQLEIPLDTVGAAFRAARTGGALTVLDPAPATELSAELLALVDIVVPNEHEVGLLGGIDRLFDLGVRSVIVTLGSAGAELHFRGGESLHVDSYDVEVVDTTGAGDAFRGALAACLAGGDDVSSALEVAVAAGAAATTTAGAVPSLPDRATIDALLASR